MPWKKARSRTLSADAKQLEKYKVHSTQYTTVHSKDISCSDSHELCTLYFALCTLKPRHFQVDSV